MKTTRADRSVILERVRAGMQHAKAHGTKSGKPIGRPMVAVDRAQVVELRSRGLSWRGIADRVGAGVGTVRRSYQTTAADATEACQNPEAGIS